MARSISRRLRYCALALPLAAALAPSGGTAANASATAKVPVPHVMGSVGKVQQGRSSGAAAPAAASLLQYQTSGGTVETGATVYLIFWGAQWQVGWSDVSNSGNVYPSSKAQTYITDFFKYVGGNATAWNATTTQYCTGVAVGATSCPSGNPHPTNPPTFGGTWVDTTSTPPPPVVNDNCVAIVCFTGGSAQTANLLAAEALRAEQHFGYNANADYMILLPKATETVGSNSVYCAYHSEATDSSGRSISFTNMPYVIDGNVGCGENFVNSDSAYGNGIYDGYSIVAGHEFAEAETDSLPNSKAAWRDSSGQENGDKCAWITPGTTGGSHNIGPDANGHSFAVQTLWSNSAGGCAG
jgi:serine protease